MIFEWIGSKNHFPPTFSPKPTIIKQISVQDNEEFQNLQHLFNQLKSEQEFIAGQMVAVKSQNSLLMNDNHTLKKENKSLKLQINNLWREVSEMKDMFLQRRVEKPVASEVSSVKGKSLAADLALGGSSGRSRVGSPMLETENREDLRVLEE